jgi:hypothetical protein
MTGKQAEISWNHGLYLHAQDRLPLLTRRGACWDNATVKLRGYPQKFKRRDGESKHPQLTPAERAFSRAVEADPPPDVTVWDGEGSGHF